LEIYEQTIESEIVNQGNGNMKNIEDMNVEPTGTDIEATKADRDAVEFEAGDIFDGACDSVWKKNGSMMNKIRGCECAPKYKVAQTWNDGRIRLSEPCDMAPSIMLDPDGTFRVKANVDTGIPDAPVELREMMLQALKNLKMPLEKPDRNGCKLLWDGRTYTYKGYY
jgi:hypothetical protein